MTTIHHEHEVNHIFKKYGEVCEWLDELGFNYSQSRYGIYQKYFKLFIKTASKSEPSVEEFLKFKNSFSNGYLEANEIIRIYNSLKRIDSIEFIDQIKKVISGQEFRARSNNDQARDFLFELSVATRFLRAGYKVSLRGICDVEVDLKHEGTLFVECKRVKSEKQLSKNIKKANTQIIKRIKASKSLKAKGLVAVNITDLLPKPSVFFPDSYEAGTRIHRGISNKYIEERIKDFATGMTKKCLGVMCESSIMHYLSANSPKAGFIYSRHTEFLPYKESNLLKSIVPKICNQNIT